MMQKVYVIFNFNRRTIDKILVESKINYYFFHEIVGFLSIITSFGVLIDYIKSP